MPIPTAESVATDIANALENPDIKASMTIIVQNILDAVKQADVLPGTFAVVVGAPGATPVTPGTKGTLL